jgi:hypothetical protein
MLYIQSNQSKLYIVCSIQQMLYLRLSINYLYSFFMDKLKVFNV